MQAAKQAYLYSSVVSSQTDKNEFIVEFYPFYMDEQSKPAAVTKNFDELLKFIEQMEENE